MFLVLTVIMLINMLVALLNNTYSKVEVNNVAVTFWSSKSVETFILRKTNQKHNQHAYKYVRATIYVARFVWVLF